MSAIAALRGQSISARMFRGVLTLASTGAIVRLFGLAKQIVIAPAFGAGPDLDAFTAAEALPLLIAVTLDAAIEAIFVPIYIRARESGDLQSADRAFSTLTNACVLIFGAISIVSIPAAPLLVRLTAPGFETDRFALAVMLAPLLYPLIGINVVISLITSALNARGAFARPMLAQAAVPIAMMVCVLVLGNQLGIVALALGELLGFVGGLVLLIIGARAAGLHYTLTLNWRSETLGLAARQSLPVLLASTLIHSNIFVDQLVASTLPPGDLSALSYALKLISLPTSVVFVAFSRVVLPHFSEQVVRADWAALRDSVRVHVWAMIGVALALTVGAVLLARPVIGLIFQRGRFDAQATDLVSTIFIAGALGFVPMGLGFVIPRVFNALQRNELLTAITVFSVCANAVLDLLLAPRLGAAGIALSTSLVLAGALAIQLVVLNHILDGFNALAFPSQWHLRLRSLSRGRSLP